MKLERDIRRGNADDSLRQRFTVFLSELINSLIYVVAILYYHLASFVTVEQVVLNDEVEHGDIVAWLLN